MADAVITESEKTVDGVEEEDDRCGGSMSPATGFPKPMPRPGPLPLRSRARMPRLEPLRTTVWLCPGRLPFAAAVTLARVCERYFGVRVGGHD